MTLTMSSDSGRTPLERLSHMRETKLLSTDFFSEDDPWNSTT